MKRLSALFLAVLLSLASVGNAAVINVTAGVDKITASPGLSSAAAGDTIILAAGTYTFGAANFPIITHGPALGRAANWFTSLTIRGVSSATVILDLTGVTGTAIYGGDATNVTIANVTFSGSAGSFMRDASNSNYQGWTFKSIKLAGMTTIPFLLGPSGWPPATGTGITIKNITTTSTFAAAKVVAITGARNNLDLLIDNIDARLHTASSLNIGVHLTNVWDVRLRNVRVDDPTDSGVKVDATAADSAATKIGAVSTVRKVYISDVWVKRAGNLGVHVGNTEGYDLHPSWPRGMVNNVHMNNIRVEGSIAGYGIEYETLVSNCTLTGFYVYNCVNYGVALAEDTEKIVVSGGFIDHITGANSAGIITSCGTQNIIVNNLIRDCDYGVKIQSNVLFLITPSRNIVRENTMVGVDYAYGVNLAAAMPSGVTANMIGPNTIVTPLVAFASDHVGASRTQAQWEADYPTSIDVSDTVVGAVAVNWLPPSLSTTIVGQWFRTGGLIPVSLGD